MDNVYVDIDVLFVIQMDHLRWVITFTEMHKQATTTADLRIR